MEVAASAKNHQSNLTAKEPKTAPSTKDTLSESVQAAHSCGKSPELHGTAKSCAYHHTVHKTLLLSKEIEKYASLQAQDRNLVPLSSESTSVHPTNSPQYQLLDPWPLRKSMVHQRTPTETTPASIP
ncbi:hypothetical protein F511_26208 [Dorcoceras hygrometricum]|uniref:Uncharacterized protein n=1 Tax=Dorcoceras hygrometricum TaxID=472368 RepID=A0A2Z7ARF6_9LAMI|nr:hypothetical protein F511_26208 [Dorcoceras hygrometricum]